MERLNEEQIKKINSSISDQWNQGVFIEPYGIDVTEKGYVIYQRHETGGVTGGNYSDTSNPQPYHNSEGRPAWEALDFTLKELCPDISYLKYKDIERLVVGSDKVDYEYYGNCTNCTIYYLPLETLYTYLEI